MAVAKQWPRPQSADPQSLYLALNHIIDLLQTGYAGADVSADDVSVTAAGNIAATNVQDALEELDDEKGTGDASGPASAMDGNIAAFDGATGKLLKDSGKSLSTIGAGRQTIWVPATAMMPFAGSEALQDNFFSNAARRGYIAFDAASIEGAAFTIAMPKSWDESSLKAQVYWMHPSTTTNFGVVWAVEAAAFGNDDGVDQDAFTGADIADTGGTADDLYISDETGDIDPGNTPAENDLLAFRVLRQATDESDTLAVDAYLIGVKLYYNTAKNTDD